MRSTWRRPHALLRDSRCLVVVPNGRGRWRIVKDWSLRPRSLEAKQRALDALLPSPASAMQSHVAPQETRIRKYMRWSILFRNCFLDHFVVRHVGVPRLDVSRYQTRTIPHKIWEHVRSWQMLWSAGNTC
mmetsp:Transcript_17461/g.30094  ORF Transcript_17461/g.30094 Transcript_17461/m.30094 type:complete len:130 (-) Transcript_17461:85-474(-)